VNLYLVQHGEAKPKEEDPERSLSDRGEAGVQKVASYLAAHTDVTVSRILHSGKTRAKQTAEILAELLKPQRGTEEASGLAPLDDPSIWAEKLRAETGDLMLVGHLPHLSRLASLLICGNAEIKVINFKNGGIVCLTRGEEGAWAIGWIIVPEIAR